MDILLNNNCLRLTKYVNEELNKLAERVNFQLPAADKLVKFGRLNRTEMCDLVIEQYPEISTGEFIRIPEILDSLYYMPRKDILKGSEQSDEGSELKDEIACRLMEILKNKNFNKRNHEGLTKVFFSNIGKLKVSDFQQGEGDKNLCKKQDYKYKVSEIWQDACEGLYISSDVGIIIFTIENRKGGSLTKEKINIRKEFVESLLNFSLGEREKNLVTINSVTIEIIEEEDKQEQTYNHISITKSDLKLTPIEESALWKYLKNIVKELYTKQKKIIKRTFTNNKTTKEGQVVYFTAKCFMLHNMQETTDLLFEHIQQQQWTKHSKTLTGSNELYICWSREQKTLIDEIIQGFNTEKAHPLRLIIRGSFGTGKTLVMLYVIREFLKLKNGRKVLVLIDKVHTQLFETIKRIFADEIVDVISPDEYNKIVTPTKYGLFTCDEINYNGDIKFILTTKDVRIHVLIFSPSPTLSLRTIENFRERNLGKRNLRSNKFIVDLCICINKARSLTGFFINSEPSGLSLHDSQFMPCIYFINTKNKVWVADHDKSSPDNSKDRDEFSAASAEFITNFISEIDHQSKTLVCNYCDPNILGDVKKITQKELSNKCFEYLYFADVKEVQGMEYANVICIIDCCSDWLNLTFLEVGMTRCSKRLILLINPIEAPMCKGNDQCSTDFEYKYRVSKVRQKQDEITRGVKEFRRKNDISLKYDSFTYAFPKIKCEENLGYASDIND